MYEMQTTSTLQHFSSVVCNSQLLLQIQVQLEKVHKILALS